jgi:hypothetical protein
MRTTPVFGARKNYEADPGQRRHFGPQLSRGGGSGKSRLGRDAWHRDALLAMTFAAGLRSDYAALIEKRNLASLHYTKDAENWVQQLLAVDPTSYDARLASGVSRYIIGSMSAPLRSVLCMGGVLGTKLAAPPNCKRRRRKAIGSPHSHASCCPELMSARKICPTLERCECRCKRLSQQYSVSPRTRAARQKDTD